MQKTRIIEKARAFATRKARRFRSARGLESRIGEYIQANFYAVKIYVKMREICGSGLETAGEPEFQKRLSKLGQEKLLQLKKLFEKVIEIDNTMLRFTKYCAKYGLKIPEIDYFDALDYNKAMDKKTPEPPLKKPSAKDIQNDSKWLAGERIKLMLIEQELERRARK